MTTYPQLLTAITSATSINGYVNTLTPIWKYSRGRQIKCVACMGEEDKNT